MIHIKLAIYRIKRIWHFFKTGLLNGVRAQLTFGTVGKNIKTLVITGTDGKTTSTNMLYHILNNSGYKVGLISTVGAYIGDEKLDTGLHVTSPQPFDLYSFITKMLKKDIEYLVLEVTSQGEYQYRTWGITPMIASVTNIDNEHLDYHLTHTEYVKAKAGILNKADTIILNEEDKSYSQLQPYLKKGKKVLTYSSEEVLPKKIEQAVDKRFPESYNQMNARMVTKMAQLVGVDDDSIAKALKSFPVIPGRMQRVKNNRDLEVIVDFAHTSQGLTSVLSALRDSLEPGARLISLFGCSGLRDYKKRPIMGKAGADLSDYTIFTADDPRTEDIWSIFRQMKEQLTENHNRIISMPNRQKAIYFAINELAKPGDTILLSGKGHEKSMAYGKDTEYPWDEIIVATAALNNEPPPYDWYQEIDD